MTPSERADTPAQLRRWLERLSTATEARLAGLARAAAAVHDSLRACPPRDDAADASLLYVAMVDVLLHADESCTRTQDAGWVRGSSFLFDPASGGCSRCALRTREVGLSLARWQRVSESLRALVEGFVEPFHCETCGRDGVLVRDLANRTAADPREGR